MRQLRWPLIAAGVACVAIGFALPSLLILSQPSADNVSRLIMGVGIAILVPELLQALYWHDRMWLPLLAERKTYREAFVLAQLLRHTLTAAPSDADRQLLRKVASSLYVWPRVEAIVDDPTNRTRVGEATRGVEDALSGKHAKRAFHLAVVLMNLAKYQDPDTLNRFRKDVGEGLALFGVSRRVIGYCDRALSGPRLAEHLQSQRELLCKLLIVTVIRFTLRETAIVSFLEERRLFPDHPTFAQVAGYWLSDATAGEYVMLDGAIDISLLWRLPRPD